MQIVIDIDEKDYNLYKVDDWHIPKCLRDALANGTPLPKGHGRLIDENTITEVYTDETEPVKINGMTIIPPRIVLTGTNAPTVIEADKAEMEDKE